MVSGIGGEDVGTVCSLGGVLWPFFEASFEGSNDMCWDAGLKPSVYIATLGLWESLEAD